MRKPTQLPAALDPPVNIEAEMGVLGSIILDGREVLDEVVAILHPDDFYRAGHELIFRSMLVLLADQAPLDIHTIAEQLRRDGKFDEVGGNDTLVEILESVPHSANGRYYADIVRQKAISREVIAAASEVITKAQSNQFTADELMDIAQARMNAVGDRRQLGNIATAREAVDDSMERLRQRDDGAIPGLATGFADYDEKTGGLHPGHLVVLAARPSIGKTAWALNVAENVSLGPEVAVLFISLEMTRSELGDRLTCGLAGVDGHRFMHSERLTSGDRIQIEAAAERLRSARLFIDDAPTRTVAEIGSIARRYRSREGIGLVVVDYLQLVEAEQERNWTPRQEQVAQMSRRFKGLAKDLGIPLVLISQLNRNAEGREDKRPQLADIRESGAVEQEANVILLIHRPEFYGGGERPGEADLIIAKNRGGQTGIVQLRFDGPTTRFSNFDSKPNRHGGAF